MTGTVNAIKLTSPINDLTDLQLNALHLTKDLQFLSPEQFPIGFRSICGLNPVYSKTQFARVNAFSLKVLEASRVPVCTGEQFRDNFLAFSQLFRYVMLVLKRDPCGTSPMERLSDVVSSNPGMDRVHNASMKVLLLLNNHVLVEPVGRTDLVKTFNEAPNWIRDSLLENCQRLFQEAVGANTDFPSLSPLYESFKELNIRDVYLFGLYRDTLVSFFTKSVDQLLARGEGFEDKKKLKRANIELVKFSADISAYSLLEEKHASTFDRYQERLLASFNSDGQFTEVTAGCEEGMQGAAAAMVTRLPAIAEAHSGDELE
jgi:hypothetical protein